MESHIKDIISGDQERIEKGLQDFVSASSQTFTFPELSKIEARTNLWNTLYNIANTSSDPNILTNCFAAIRILSREKTYLNELVSEQWFDLIKHHTGLVNEDFEFNGDKVTVAVEALKALCNIIFNSPVAATLCCKNDILQGIIRRFQKFNNDSIPTDIKFFDGKILFLITALCSDIRQKTKDQNAVGLLTNALEHVLKQAAETANKDADSPRIRLDDAQVDLVCEILKALFNLTLNLDDSEEEIAKCTTLVSTLRIYLLVPTADKEKTALVHSNVINLLTNMPNDSYAALMTYIQPGLKLGRKFQFEDQNMTAFYEILMFLKNRFSGDIGVSAQVEVLSPVITLLLKCAKSHRVIRKYLRMQILPPLKDVHNRPEEGNTLRNNLCRLLTSPMTRLKDLAAQLLFVLCKMNVNRMIKYTGYGNAAGLFAQRGLLGGKPDKGEAYFSSTSEDSETEEYSQYKHGINPVTGRYEEPHPNPMENMTEEQKEYEAMKLVELIDNLTKCGAIKPCRVGEDGKPHPIEHILQLQEGLKSQQIQSCDDDSD